MVGLKGKEGDGVITEDIDTIIILIMCIEVVVGVKTHGMKMMSSSCITDINKTTMAVTITDNWKGEIMVIMVIEEVIRGIVIVRGGLVFMNISGTEDIISIMEINIMEGVGKKNITAEVQEVTTTMITEEVKGIRSLVTNIIHGKEKGHHMQVQREISRLLTTLHQWRMMICHNLPGQGKVEGFKGMLQRSLNGKKEMKEKRRKS